MSSALQNPATHQETAAAAAVMHNAVLASERTLEACEAHQTLAAISKANRPSLLQVQTLLLDPAVAQEFGALRKALETKGDAAARLQDELQVLQDGNMSRALVAKCHALQVCVGPTLVLV